MDFILIMKLEVTMSQSVTIKSNKYGINLVLDPEIGFDELLKDVVEKFKASSTFFKNAKLALSFEGRKLSEEEEQQIIYQRQMLERYARERGYNNTRFYIDDGVSGTTFQRSGFQQMISDIQSGQVRRVIVKDMSRFGRDYLQVGMYTEVLFLENDIHFIAVNDGVDSEKGENDFTPLRNLFNEWYARDTSKKSGQFSGQREPPGNA